MFARNSFLSVLFLISILATGFYLVEIGSGYARIYHFVAVMIVAINFSNINRLLSSKVFIYLMLFVIVNFIAVIFSDTPLNALASFTSFMGNIVVAMAVTLILIRGKVTEVYFVKILIWVTVISTLFGLIQIIASKFGIILALSEAQESQILIGFGPGFSYEANTFAKFIMIPFFIHLSFLINKVKNTRFSGLVLFIIFSGFIMNFTRTAIFGFAIALMLMFFWYALRGRRTLIFIKKMSSLLVISIFSFGLIMSGAVSVSDYAKYKIESIFNESNLSEDKSAIYRMTSMQLVVNEALNSQKKLYIGNGWGQSKVIVDGEEVQVGGGDVVNILGFSGVIGVVFYLLFYFSLINGSRKSIYLSNDGYKAALSEGVLFAWVAIFFTTLLSGMLITGEFWMLVGLTWYISLKSNKERAI
jgi:hypothetical protein